MPSNSSDTHVVWHSNDSGDCLVSVSAFCIGWIKYAYNFQLHPIGSYLRLCWKVLRQHSRWRWKRLAHVLGSPLFHSFTRKLLSIHFVSDPSWSYYKNARQGGCLVAVLGSPVHILCCAGICHPSLHWPTTFCFSFRLEGPLFRTDKDLLHC